MEGRDSAPSFSLSTARATSIQHWRSKKGKKYSLYMKKTEKEERIISIYSKVLKLKASSLWLPQHFGAMKREVLDARVEIETCPTKKLPSLF